MKLRFSIAALLTFFSLHLSWGEGWLLQNESLINNDFRYAMSFLERYRKLLNSSPSEAVADTIRRVKEDGLKFKVGKDKDFQKLTGDEDFSISLTDGIYNAEWSKDNKIKVACTFPANIGLLTYSNKIELEKRMASKIENIKDSLGFPKLVLISKNKLNPVKYSDLFINDKGFYITPRLRNLLVYENSEFEDSCQLLTTHSGIYLLESVQNMMLTGCWPAPITVNLTLSEYGYKKSKFHKPLSAIYDIFESEGSVPYWGIESFNGNIIKGVYVWKNEPGGFNHVLSVEIPIGILEKGGDINATLFCYIRTDNLKYLFEEFEKQR